MGKKVKTIYFVNGFLFSLLFITLLRNQIREIESGFFEDSPPCLLAKANRGANESALFSLLKGRPVSPSQGGQYERKVRGALNRKEGGPVRRDAGRPALSHSGGRGTPKLRPPHISDWLDELIETLMLVESGGQTDPPDGDGGRAVGALQIHKGAVDDVNRHYQTNFSYDDRRDFPKARLIARLYISMWLERHREEIAARIFNGGPRGWAKKSTDRYWEKVREAK